MAISSNHHSRWNMPRRHTNCATGPREREKLRISAHYFSATGEIDKEAQTYELWIADYPRDFVPHGNLGRTTPTSGQYDKALAEKQETLRLAPITSSTI